MANRLSLQSATCSAFQLQLCRQPHNDNDTKTVSSFGSDCTRAMQSPPHNPTTWWGITGCRLIHRLCLVSLRKIVSKRKRDCMCLFSYECVRVCCICTACLCTVQNESMHVWARRGKGGVCLTVLQWCIPPPVACTARPPPPHCPPAQRRTDPGSGPGWWPACPPPLVLPPGSPAQEGGDYDDEKIILQTVMVSVICPQQQFLYNNVFLNRFSCKLIVY